MNISWSLQYVKVLTSNQFAAPAGSQAAKPPFLLCIVDMNTVKYQGNKKATKKKKETLTKFLQSDFQKAMRVNYFFINRKY